MYYHYINIPLLANKSRWSDLLSTPLVVSRVLLLLLLSVQERLQQLQPLLDVWRHRGHGGLQQLQSLLQLSVCRRGPAVTVMMLTVQFRIVCDASGSLEIR